MQVEAFWKKCYRYAQSKGASKEKAEDFAQEAWIWVFSRKWNISLKHLWIHYLRKVHGTRGYSTYAINLKIDYRQKVKTFDGKIIDFLENCVPDKPLDRIMKLNSLSKLQQMIFFLLEAGFTKKEICEAFQYSHTKLKQAITRARLKLADSEEALEMFNRDTEDLIPEIDKQKLEHEKRVSPSGLMLSFDELSLFDEEPSSLKAPDE